MASWNVTHVKKKSKAEWENHSPSATSVVMNGIESANYVLNHFVTRTNFETVAQLLPKKFREIFWGPKIFDFRRIPLFCFEKRLSKAKMTIFSKNVAGNDLFAPPLLRLCFEMVCVIWDHKRNKNTIRATTVLTAITKTADAMVIFDRVTDGIGISCQCQLSANINKSMCSL